ENLAAHVDSVLLGAIQHVDNYTPATRAQYAALARRSGMVGVVGTGVAPGVRDGVHHGSIPAGDPLARNWPVIPLHAEGAIALLATQADPSSRDWFDYRVTSDRAVIDPIARRLMSAL